MPSKRKKTDYSAPRRIYTTKQIMEITEQRRLKEEAASKEIAVKEAAIKEAASKEFVNKEVINKEVVSKEVISQEFVSKELISEKVISEEAANNEVIAKEVEPEIKMPENKPAPVLEDLNQLPLLPAKDTPQVVFILSLTAFLLVIFLNFPKPWAHLVAEKLNACVLYGSFFIFSIAQIPCTVKGAILNIHYYKISLQDDLLALYSLELLIAFAVLFIFLQKTSLVNRWVIFISLIPLAVVANIFRVLWTCGLALNYGTVLADRYFHGVLVGFVFIFIVLGLIFFEFLSSPD